MRTEYYHHQSCTGVVGAQPPLVHALPPTITPPSPTRSHPLHSPTTLPHQTATRPPLTAPFHQPRIVFLHYKPTSGLNFFLHRLGLRRCGGGGSAAHCFDAQPRTLLFCRHHSSITPRCNRAPGHITRRRLARERAFTVVSPKKSPKLPLRRLATLGLFAIAKPTPPPPAQTSISDGHTMALSGLTGGRSGPALAAMRERLPV